MKKTSAKNTTSRSAKATGGRASGRTQRASANARSAAAGSRKAATSRAGAGSKPTAKKATAKAAAKPKSKATANSRSKVAAQSKAKTAAKAAPKKAASRSTVARRAAAPKIPVRNSRSTARKQASTKDLLLELFHDEIKDIYWAEKNIIKALPKLKKAATSPELQAAFDAHLAQTQEHASRLEEVFEKLDKKVQAKKCEAMDGLLKEGESIISDTEAGTATRDVGLILAAQKVEHYEIATYGGLAQLARTLRLDDIAELLETTLQEEKDTDMKLTNIAESHVNYDALAESEGPQSATSKAGAIATAASVGGDEDDDEDEDDEEDIDFEEADIDVDEDEDDEEDEEDEEDLDEDEDEEEDEQI